MLIPMRTGHFQVLYSIYSDRKTVFHGYFFFLPEIRVTPSQNKLDISTNGRQYADEGVWREPLWLCI